MFNNIGRKIKGVAQFVTWLGILSSVIVFLTLMDDDTIGIAFAILIVGIVGSWLSSLLLYGFGQLIENSDTIARSINKTHPVNSDNTSISKSPDIEEPEDKSLQKDRLATWLRIGAITQEEYDREMKKIEHK